MDNYFSRVDSGRYLPASSECCLESKRNLIYCSRYLRASSRSPEDSRGYCLESVRSLLRSFGYLLDPNRHLMEPEISRRF